VGELLAKARKLADDAGHLRFAWPKEMGGKGGSQLAMAIIREHLAAKGLGLFNDLQTEHSIVGNNPFVLMFKEFATNAQYDRYADDLLNGPHAHGLRPDRAEPRLRRHLDGDPRGPAREGRQARLADQRRKDVDDGDARRELRDVLRRTSGKDGDAVGITCFIVPANSPV
jgi:acyl-CoA dehydrogenase